MASWYERVAEGGLAAALGAGGIWAWLTARAKAKADSAAAYSKQPADLLTATAGFHAALSAQAEAFTKTLLEVNAKLAAQVEELISRVHDLEEENQQCRGENRQMAQRVESLEAYLRRRGVDVPASGMAGTLTVFEGDEITVYKAGEQQE